jgi:hypothetical protein
MFGFSRRLAYGAVCLGALALVGAGYASSRTKLPASLRPAPAATYITGTTSGPLLYVQNNGTSEFDTFGVAGATAGGPFAIGVLGYGANSAAANLAVTGYDIGPGSIASVGDAVFPEPSGGPGSTATTGVLGLAADGDGVMGQTAVQHGSFGVAPSDASVSEYAGIIGIDNTSNHGENAGVLGVTTNGYFGVEGVAGTGSYAGVEGTGTNGDGVDGLSQSGTGVNGQSITGPAFSAYSFAGDGMDVTVSGTSNAIKTSGGSYGLYAQTGGSGAAVFAENTATSGLIYGVSGDAPDGTGIYADGLYGLFANGLYAIEAQASSSTGYPLSTFPAAGGGSNFYVTDSGDVYYQGTLNHLVSTAKGTVGRAFASQSTMQTMEDFGSGSIVNGSGTVSLDASFAQMIDGTGYQVFLTPQGDCNGLYIARKSASSFVVRELHGGHASLAFDYRIVGRQYAHSADRSTIAQSSAAFGAPRARVTAAQSEQFIANAHKASAAHKMPGPAKQGRGIPTPGGINGMFPIPRAAAGLSLNFGH